ncbi:MAG: ABC transporter ATP-binding protein [Kiritimatiellae bacterium]|nr:ABC transporter ATP-binding protein [Kiritimatiellia bacterium]
MKQSIKNLVEVFVFFRQRYLRIGIILVICLVLMSVLEGVGIGLFLPLFELIAKGEAAGTSPISQLVTRLFTVFHLPVVLGTIVLFVVVVMLAKGIVRWLTMRQVAWMTAQIGVDMRLELFDALLRADWDYASSRATGRFANAVGVETKITANMFRHIVIAVACFLQVVVYLLLALVVSWKVALLSILAGLFMLLLFHKLIMIAKMAGKQTVLLQRALVIRLIDIVGGLKSVKAMGQESLVYPILKAKTEKLRKAEAQTVMTVETMSAFQEPLTMVMLAIGAYVLLKFTSIEFAPFVMLALLFTRSVGQINQMITNYQAIAVKEGGFFELRKEVAAARAHQEVGLLDEVSVDLSRSIALQGVTKKYADAEPVLENISLEIRRGQMIAFRGPSGCGKTTMADIISGIIRPTSGQVLVDGEPLTDVRLKGWRHRIGYVPQEVLLLEDSVYANVTLGDRRISREKCIEALKKANAWDFVSRLQDNIDYVVGRAGAGLSGGQRQRIAIARALVRDPAVLVLDEVTRSLDRESEKSICESIAALKGSITIIAISHQEAFISLADELWEFEGSGKVIVKKHLFK